MYCQDGAPKPDCASLVLRPVLSLGVKAWLGRLYFHLLVFSLRGAEEVSGLAMHQSSFTMPPQDLLIRE